ncbi:MAG TPA: BON domain-containing protein [Planctomycetaceae bacterium]|nr:BON domain-containing protein [Planctomycetaceae bacterium]
MAPSAAEALPVEMLPVERRFSLASPLAAPDWGGLAGGSAKELSSRVTALAGGRADSPISVSVSDGVATIEGVVKTPYDRVVVAALVLLEPGVWKVDNRLTLHPRPLSRPTPSAGED